MEDYLCWFAHRELFVRNESMGERVVGSTSSASNVHAVANDISNPYRNMVMDAMRMNQGNVSQCPIIEEEPNADATRFFDLLKDSDEPLWDGCTNHSKLSVVAHVFTIKSDHGLSEAGYEKIIEWTKSILPEGNRLKENFYAAKSMMKPFDLGYQKIDMCRNFCMLYYLENAELTECITCKHSCYKPITGRGKTLVAYKKLRYFPITPRLQRLFMSPKTAEHMIWHQSHNTVDGVMVHPSNDEAWKHFNSVHPHFLAESRNVCLGLCTNIFNPFGSFAAPYSCWPVILTVYNLPPGVCMRSEFMFLSTIILGPSSPSWNIDVCLQPLIDELMQLWSSGALIYNISRKYNFVMRAALMWTINDFLAYGMVSGWSTHGKIACPYCMENNKAFTLTNEGNASFFYCHCSFLPPNHRRRKNIKDFFVGRVEKDVAPLFLSGEELHDVVSEYGDIVFGLQSGKQKFPGFGLTHNWVKRSIF
jgi:hypothetical protein